MPSNQFHRVEKLVGECEAWQAVTFENSWANRGSAGDPDASYYKDPFGRVWFKGAIDTGSSNTTAFTLPSGYRPSDRLVFPVDVVGSTTQEAVIIASDGTFKPVYSAGTAVYINNISFRAEQ